MNIGHDTGGLSKMPGFYFKAEAASLLHLAAKLDCSIRKAADQVQSDPEKHRQMVRTQKVF